MTRLLIVVAVSACILFSLFATGTAATTQIAPPNWALDRIDQRTGSLDNSYGYMTTGEGVHIYVVDSGINRFHNDFAGRVVIDKDWVTTGGDGSDCTKHGTAVAGLAAGTQYGVAKKATIHVHRVFGCPLLDTLNAREKAEAEAAEIHRVSQALNSIAVNHQSPAVVNLSYSKRWLHNSACPTTGSASSSCLEFLEAIRNVLASGVPVVGAAGNAAGPLDEQCSEAACEPFYSCKCEDDPPNNIYRHWDPQYNLPANADYTVITVGAAGFWSSPNGWDHRIKDTKYMADVYAPGWQLLTASTESPTATQIFNYTSAATAVVTGVVARYLQSHPFATPAEVHMWIYYNATNGSISHVPLSNRKYIYMSPLE